MSLSITSLNSGSNGNCYYVGNSQEAILVDAGLSCKETELRMQRLGLSLNNVKGIFISHEHADHIRGVPVLATKYELPVYITTSTLRKCRFKLPKPLIKSFRANDPIQIGDLQVTAFAKLHDAVEPHSFVINNNSVKVGVFTDIGAPCQQLIYHFQQCHAAFLESNYDEEMLDNGKYPYYLKTRIRGGHGHLSNKQALQLFLEHKPSYMSHLLLSHLSKENNCPHLVKDLFASQANGTEIIVASRFEETPVYNITSTTDVIIRSPLSLTPKGPLQMELF